ncbi:MAG: prepilin-type N-terminal cleavage/methylation domain-containing protein, partial [Gammaproteobacteria bacterium]|nr:prepilin-type N-terminal cleavage/methylation domain-containing protein [Gammaproteobacteria bacterium]
MSLRAGGFSLIELLMAVAIGALLLAIVLPVYTEYVERSRAAQAIADIGGLDMRIEQFTANNFRLPASLADLPGDLPLDPWGRAYRYLRIQGAGPGVMGQVRKDRNLNPINSDFDLFSAGPDGDSRPPLVARPSRDDIVRGGSGSFIGG